jgi:hypothetical protein
VIAQTQSSPKLARVRVSAFSYGTRFALIKTRFSTRALPGWVAVEAACS